MPTLETSKDTIASEPNRSSSASYWALLNDCRHRMVDSVQWFPTHPEKPTSRDVVRNFMSLLAPPIQATPSLSRDVERFGRVVKSILRAVEEEILTKDEAEAVIDFIAGRFTQRRMDEVLSKITTPKHGAWFMVQHKSTD